jgi:hypothetical protein
VLWEFHQLLLELRATHERKNTTVVDLCESNLRETGPLGFLPKKDYSARMTTTFRLNSDELDASFIERLKALFPHQQIAIAVTEADETEYLLSDPERRERLLHSISNVEQGRNIVVPDQTMFQ